MLEFYRGSLLFTVFAVVAGYLLDGVAGAWIVLVLGALETSLSFDNAVVNASILQNWSEKWRNRFIRYGMPVAVFGMRFAFPIAIVAIVTSLNPIDAVKLAVHEPLRYSAIMESVHLQIAAFGGAFLLMIFFNYFLDSDKEIHWIHTIEAPMTKVGPLGALLTLVITWFASTHVVEAERLSFMMAGVWGLVTYMAVDVLGGLVEGGEADAGDVAARIIKEGVVGLLYLELIDASCSFDGVIGAFAISTNIFMIGLGLGVGAFFVRSMTLQLVAKGTLTEYRYLEHGAFWSIGALATIMYLSVVVDTPDYVTGSIGISLLIAALFSSIRANRAEKAQEALEQPAVNA